MFKIDRELMINLMKEKIEEGYEAIRNTNITQKECVQAIVNVFELEKTINDVMDKDRFDKEMTPEVKAALDKNADVEVEVK